MAVQLERRGPGDILPLEENLSLAGQILSGDEVKDRALSRPVRADDGMPLPLLDAQVDPEENFQTIKVLIDVL